jgi:hypothetical protein
MVHYQQVRDAWVGASWTDGRLAHGMFPAARLRAILFPFRRSDFSLIWRDGPPLERGIGNG